jgi:hypothetical protein
VAVIAGRDGLAVTDGSRVVDVVTLPDATWQSGSAAAGDESLLAFDVGDELVAIDLATGALTRRPCPGCNGVAVAGDEVISADGSFTMYRFDAELGLAATIPMEHVSEPRDPEAPQEIDPVVPTVLGAVDGRVAMSYRTTNGSVRGGPDVVSFYGLDGALQKSWTVDGLVLSSAVDAGGTRLLLGVGGSGGACNTLSVPVLIEPSATEPVVLVDDEELASAGSRDYAANDLWWNGPEAVVFGTLSGMSDTGCRADHSLRRFDLHGELETEPVAAITAYRFLGADCDRALMVDTSADLPDLRLLDGSAGRTIEGYETIVWSAPRPEPCASFPGLDQP